MTLRPMGRPAAGRRACGANRRAPANEDAHLGRGGDAWKSDVHVQQRVVGG
jgi:hypothetical protein